MENNDFTHEWVSDSIMPVFGISLITRKKLYEIIGQIKAISNTSFFNKALTRHWRQEKQQKTASYLFNEFLWMGCRTGPEKNGKGPKITYSNKRHDGVRSNNCPHLEGTENIKEYKKHFH